MSKKIIIGIIAVLIVGLGGWKIYTDQVSSSEKANETQSSTSEQQSSSKNKNSENKDAENKDSENNDSENNNNDDKTKDDKDNNKEDKDNKSDNKSEDKSDNSNDTAQVDKDSNSTTSKDNKNESKDKGNKKDTKKDSDKSSNNSIKTPYKVSSTGMQINKIKSYSGKFVENGSDKKVSNILALEVKNTSKKDLQYGQIKLQINNKKTATFDLTNLPAGKTVTVIESTGSISYNSGDSYKYEEATYASVDKLPMSENKVKVSTNGSDIIVENISNKDLGTVYVYYKNTKDNSYLGGITYRAKFENVQKGKLYTASTSHFSDSSKIVMVDTEN